MSIWFTPYNTEIGERMRKGTMLEHLGIEIIAVGDDYVSARMPVDHRTKQPAGLLHGGASVVLAESLGSVAANLVVDPALATCVGLEINANHIRAVRDGWVTGTARPIHIGATTQLWAIEIRNERDQLVCISRLTIAVLMKKGKKLEKYL
jgi:1,4-dihydroxy-2-naphthoyl-CoA hydrolase